MTSRRQFLKNTGLMAGATLVGSSVHACSLDKSVKKTSNSMMKLFYKPFDLQLKHVFTIASNSRTTTPLCWCKWNMMV